MIGRVVEPTSGHLPALPGAVSDELLDSVRTKLAGEPGDLSPHRVAEALRAPGRPVGDSVVLAVHEALRRDAVGAGPLEPLLRTPGVTDVLVNGPAAVFWDRGQGLERADVRFPDEASVRRLAQRLAASRGRRLDDAAPFVDVRLADGTRFHAVLSPVASPGTLISLRVPAAQTFGMEDFVAAGSMCGETAELLAELVTARLAFLISGGTGCGKTTLLSAMLAAVPADERLVIVEDAAELRPPHSHLVTLEARPPNVEGAGAIVLRDLVRQALRMRPDRLVVGEVRGAEVVDLMAALNTGHEGGCGTLHANSAVDVPARIEALALAAGLPRAAAHSQFASAIDVVIQLTRDRDGQRRLEQIAVPRQGDDGLVQMEVAAVRHRDEPIQPGPAARALAAKLDR
jgi:pilus assembly protein CpaF